MVALYGGQETIPGQVDHPVNLTVAEVNAITQAGWLSPEESQAVVDQARRQREIEAETARLREVYAEGRRAGEEFYAEGGAGYGTQPGGPDYVYMPSDAPLTAKLTYTALDPYYGEGGIFEPVTDLVTGEGDARSNLLLYGALAVGALALLKR